MVEVIAAVAILAMVVLAVLTTISFSQTTILSGSSEGSAAAQAQNIADALIAGLHGKTDANIGTVGGAIYVDSTSGTFPNPSIDKQYTATAATDTTTAISGYKITVAVYYTDKTGRKCVQLTAFSAKDGG